MCKRCVANEITIQQIQKTPKQIDKNSVMIVLAIDFGARGVTGRARMVNSDFGKIHLFSCCEKQVRGVSTEKVRPCNLLGSEKFQRPNRPIKPLEK